METKAMTEPLSALERQTSAETRQHTDDDETRDLFATLIKFIASATANHDDKWAALDAVNKLTARMLP